MQKCCRDATSDGSDGGGSDGDTPFLPGRILAPIHTRPWNRRSSQGLQYRGDRPLIVVVSYSTVPPNSIAATRAGPNLRRGCSTASNRLSGSLALIELEWHHSTSGMRQNQIHRGQRRQQQRTPRTTQISDSDSRQKIAGRRKGPVAMHTRSRPVAVHHRRFTSNNTE